MTLATYRRTVDDLSFRHKSATRQVETEEEALQQAKTKTEATEEAQGIAQGIAQSLQQRAHDQIAIVVTRCLNAVFDNPYEFQIKFDQKRGKTEAKLTFARDGLELDDPLNEVGGGVIDVAAMALRLACILLSRPPRRRLLVLDEPLKCVRGKENRSRVRGMLLKLSEELGFQIVLNVDVDAYPEFCLGKIISL